MSSALEEHIDYLSMKGRYELFEAALARVISHGDKVADLGCGVGVLGLQCLKVGASKVYGIDSSEAIHLAQETMLRAGVAERYDCISASTFDTDLLEKVDVLVCDHIGYFGFDYGLIDMIKDAAMRMLKPGGAIVPDRLRLSIAGVSSTELRDTASAWKNENIPQEYHWIDEQAHNYKYGADLSRDDLCSRPAVLAEIGLGSDAPGYFSSKSELSIQDSAIFDGIAGWFDCHLGGDVWMTNSPLEGRAIDRPQAFFPVREPFAVEKGDKVGVGLRFDSGGELIAWSITHPGGKKTQELSTFNSTILAPDTFADQHEQPIGLSKSGKDRAFVLSKVDGKRSLENIIKLVAAERQGMFPNEAAIRAFVESVVEEDCIVHRPS